MSHALELGRKLWKRLTTVLHVRFTISEGSPTEAPWPRMMCQLQKTVKGAWYTVATTNRRRCGACCIWCILVWCMLQLPESLLSQATIHQTRLQPYWELMQCPTLRLFFVTDSLLVGENKQQNPIVIIINWYLITGQGSFCKRPQHVHVLALLLDIKQFG